MKTKCSECGVSHTEREFEICVSYTLYNYVTVSAVSEDEARKKALDMLEHDMPCKTGWADYNNNMRADVV